MKRRLRSEPTTDDRPVDHLIDSSGSKIVVLKLCYLRVVRNFEFLCYGPSFLIKYMIKKRLFWDLFSNNRGVYYVIYLVMFLIIFVAIWPHQYSKSRILCMFMLSEVSVEVAMMLGSLGIITTRVVVLAIKLGLLRWSCVWFSYLGHVCWSLRVLGGLLMSD